jgi:rhodanese-related sulfurtransferase
MVEVVKIRGIDSVSGVPQDPAHGDQLREVSALQADEAVAVGASLLDVREPEEYDAGHAPLATSIPLGELGQRIAELPRDALIVCVCRSGVRSAAAAVALVTADFDAVNLAGGMHAWAADGLPIVTANGAPGTVI